MKELRKVVKEQKIKSLALPQIATGVGDLSLEDAPPQIEIHLADLKVPIILYGSAGDLITTAQKILIE